MIKTAEDESRKAPDLPEMMGPPEQDESQDIAEDDLDDSDDFYEFLKHQSALQPDSQAE